MAGAHQGVLRAEVVLQDLDLGNLVGIRGHDVLVVHHVGRDQ